MPVCFLLYSHNVGMKNILFAILIFIPVLSWAQAGLVSGEIVVSSIPANTGGGVFEVSGTFSDSKGLYFASDIVATLDTASLALWKGNSYYEVLTAVANGTLITLTVDDTYSTGFLPTGIYSIGQETARLKLPGVGTTGDSNPSLTTPPDYAAKLNYILRLIDQGVGEDQQLGTHDQTLTGERLIDLDTFGMSIDASGARPDSWLWSWTDRQPLTQGWYVNDGPDGSISWMVERITAPPGAGGDPVAGVLISRGQGDRVDVGNLGDSLYLTGEKVFINPFNGVTQDATLSLALARDPVTGELKETPIGGEGADGVIVSGTYDAANQELDFSGQLPAADFSVDISVLEGEIAEARKTYSSYTFAPASTGSTFVLPTTPRPGDVVVVYRNGIRQTVATSGTSTDITITGTTLNLNYRPFESGEHFLILYIEL